MISIITPTHNPKWLEETWWSIKRQTSRNWEWVIVPNGEVVNYKLKDLVGEDDERIRVVPYNGTNKNIGAIKRFAFMQGNGDFLLESDHDDVLVETAVEELEKAITPEVDFLYSDCADFSPKGDLVTYHDPSVYEAWKNNGWKFKTEIIDGTAYLAPISWEPSAASLRLIYYAPNHFRAWRKDFYHRIGGHHSDYPVADDHELLLRTFLMGRMKRIPKVLYLYRVENNTWSGKVDEIRERTFRLLHENWHRLVERQCFLDGMPMVDLCGGFNSPEGWTSVDLDGGEIQADLRCRWPFEDGSVGAFRAFDALEHLPDKMHTMSEIYRCLKPGGFLLSATPSALGQGAFQDPTHVSYWVPNSFRYYTDRKLAKYIKNDRERFMEVRIFQTEEEIPYVIGDLIKLDGKIDETIPGIKNI